MVQSNGNGKGRDSDPDEDITIIRPSPVHPDVGIEYDLKGNLKDQVDMPDEIKPDDPDQPTNKN